jgi:pimeloyl-ACP methyl ester carboxylesterase
VIQEDADATIGMGWPTIGVTGSDRLFSMLGDRALNADGLSGTWNWLEKDLTLVTIPGAGHFVQQDAAELVTSTMEWWLSMRARR